MRYAVYLPLFLSLALAPPLVTATVRRLPDHLNPRTAVRLISATLLGMAVASTLSLGLLIVGGVVRVVDGTTSTAHGHADPGGLLAGILAVLVLALALLGLGRTYRRTLGRRRAVGRWLRDAHRPVGVDDPFGLSGPLRVIDDDAVYAWAAPRIGRRPGRIVLSTGLLATLDGAERDAVVAHEQEHLDGRHHRYLTLAAFAVAMNPALGPLRSDLGYALERCADEVAARRVDDRAVVARAIGRAALAARRHPPPARSVERSLGADAALMLGATGGPVPRRVAALLATASVAGGSRSIGWCHPVAAVRSGAPVVASTVGIVIIVAGLAVAGAVHASCDLADILISGTATHQSSTTILS